jgi:hypothetical protein
MSLTDRDKTILRNVASITCQPGCNKAQRDVADHLRTRFPHLSDADLAAVLINVAGPAAAIARANTISGPGVAAFVAGVAAELAALEIGGGP